MNTSPDEFDPIFCGNEYTELLWNVIKNMSINAEHFPLLWNKPVGEVLTVCSEVLAEDHVSWSLPKDEHRW